jgi:hypothetical protein
MIILENTALLNRYCGQKPKKILINPFNGCNAFKFFLWILMTPFQGNRVVYEG